jgi:hypothetical protein
LALNIVRATRFVAPLARGAALLDVDVQAAQRNLDGIHAIAHAHGITHTAGCSPLILKGCHFITQYVPSRFDHSFRGG